MSDFREIRLPDELCGAVEKRFAPRFARVDDLLVFILEELGGADATAIDHREQQIIEQRLRDLGYI